MFGAEDLGCLDVRFWEAIYQLWDVITSNLHRPKAEFAARICQSCRVLKGPGGVEPRGGGVPGEPFSDSVWEDWGTLGKIRGITTRDPKQNPITN